MTEAARSWEPLPDDEELPLGVWSREEVDAEVRDIAAGLASLKRSHQG